ncbi:tail fiber domain-containing protein [Geotalea toluenoxydans]|uniref:tail fiber domain-containing protein n=1 Tax=Geotalea toluenoxydans TaxID=421624 RepID=UPI0006D21E04|nr:tail fiber domain-containing protein [Geotalea toluenoxydans]
MKSIIRLLVAGFMLVVPPAFAGNGDMVVDGNLGIGTLNPTVPLNIGNNIVTPSLSTLTGSQAQINDSSSTTAAGNQLSLFVVNQPNVSSDSFASNKAIFGLSVIPASVLNYTAIAGVQGRTDFFGSSTLATEYSGLFNAFNQSTGTVTSQYGVFGQANNMSSGTIVDQCSLYGVTYNSIGTVTNSYALSLGSPATAAVKNDNGTITNGFGIYIGTIQANNKYSLFASDPNAPSYFAGSVGIGTNTPSFALDVIGQVASNGVALTSDAKFKKGIDLIDTPLEKIKQLKGVSYTWRIEEFKSMNFPQGRHYGVIAQEIEKVLPEVVNTSHDGTKSVAYTEIIPVLIEAVKAQQKLIDQQAAELKEIREQLRNR